MMASFLKPWFSPKSPPAGFRRQSRPAGAEDVRAAFVGDVHIGAIRELDNLVLGKNRNVARADVLFVVARPPRLCLPSRLFAQGSLTWWDRLRRHR